MTNLKQTIDAHNKATLTDEAKNSTLSGGNCRNPVNCPLPDNCKVESTKTLYPVIALKHILDLQEEPLNLDIIIINHHSITNLRNTVLNSVSTFGI